MQRMELLVHTATLTTEQDEKLGTGALCLRTICRKLQKSKPVKKECCSVIEDEGEYGIDGKRAQDSSGRKDLESYMMMNTQLYGLTKDHLPAQAVDNFMV